MALYTVPRPVYDEVIIICCAEITMLQIDRMVPRSTASLDVHVPGASALHDVENQALGLTWQAGPSGSAPDGLLWLMAVARVEQAIRDAQAQQESFCRVMFRCQDGWTALGMKTLARHLQASFACQARSFADRFETDRTRQHVWVELTW